MLWPLRILFASILVGMIATITWASWQCPIFSIPRDVFTHPWFIATLIDAYLAFVSFSVWAAWKEQRVPAGILWFIAVMLLGNPAIAIFFLRELFSIQRSSELSLVFTRRNPGNIALPGVLVLIAVGIYALG